MDAGSGRVTITVPEFVTDEWADVVEMPSPDFEVRLPHAFGSVYVREMKGPYDFHVQVGWLASLVVERDHRGQGLGTEVMRARLDWLRTRGCFWAALHCEPEMVPFNRRFNFRPAPNIPGPGVSMVCRLGNVGWPETAKITWREPW